MKTIVNKNSGKVLFATLVEVYIAEDEIAIDEMVTEDFENPHFNFETRTFYNVPLAE
jgi:hypothetical protein